MLNWLFGSPARLKRIDKNLLAVLAVTKTLMKEYKRMSAALDKLTTEVAEANAVMTSAAALITGLAAQIRDLKNDPVALEALAAELDSGSNALAAAVAENTVAENEEPSDETPPAEEPPVEEPPVDENTPA